MKNLIIFIDCGDTLVDESLQVFDEKHICDGELVLKAGLIDGAKQMMDTLHERGYRIALVADGYVESFKNITKQHDFDKCFETKVISEAVGVCKPDKLMFKTAIENMNLTKDDKIIMVGNNIERDIRGANEMGIISVLIDFSPRYRMIPNCKEEIPDYTIRMPLELLDLVEKLESELSNIDN